MTDRPMDTEEAFEIAFDGYLAGYPLVTLDSARRRHPAGPNRFVHARPGEAVGLCSPNPHVVYSSAWLDLRGGPVVISLPELRARHFVMPMMDAWGEIFASLGVRRRGAGAQHLVVVGPGWSGSSTDDLPVVRAPTNAVWLLGRTLIDPLDDIDDGPWNDYFLTPKCLRSGMVADAPEAEWEPWPASVEPPDAEDFLDRLAALMTRHPPGVFRSALGRRLARLGVSGSRPFRLDDLPADVAASVREGVAAAHNSISESAWPEAPGSDHWNRLSRPGGGRLSPLERAAIIRRGFGFNLRDDAVYYTACEDAAGAALNGETGYHLHFEPKGMPPVGAFWSMAAYDEKGHLPAAGAGDQVGLSSRDPLRFNPDGSLDVRIQTQRPTGPAGANWVPAPAGRFRLILRTWQPGATVLDGRWTPPPLRRVTAGDRRPHRKRLSESVGVGSGAPHSAPGHLPDIGRDWMAPL
ncbi:DUF1254 domain-containing protein [Brevundimonas lenta]|nr:DUF1254 domain-containing protein [Brevundimonas lenta]